MPFGGFWSYVHRDDETELGRIAQLARDVVAKYEMLTGEEIELFLDRDDLAWGERWQEVVDGSLSSVAFFIPVVTPRYFQSAQCRRELRLFAERAQALGIQELIMPLKYVDVPALSEDDPDDDLIGLIKDFLWEDWTDLAYADRASEAYRRGVALLAERLVNANRAAEQADVAGAAAALEPDDDSGDDDVPGALDRMAGAEEALPQWQETIEEIGRLIGEVGDLMNRASEEMAVRDSRGAGFAGRLAVARDTARDLQPRSDQILALSNSFTSELHAIDAGVREMISRAPADVVDSPGDREQVCEFFNNVRAMSQNAREGLGALEGLVEATRGVENMSRDLRPPLRTLRKGLTVMHEGRNITDGWLQLVDASPLDCSGLDLN